MKIAIVGTGYVGLVTGTCLAEIDAGNIICVDIDDIKINNLKKYFYDKKYVKMAGANALLP